MGGPREQCTQLCTRWFWIVLRAPGNSKSSADRKQPTATIKMMEQSTPNLKALRLYLRYMWRFPRLCIIGTMFSLMMALQATAVPLLVALLLGQVIHQHVVNVGLLILTGGLQIVLMIVSYFTDLWGVALLHHEVEQALYQDNFDYLVEQDYSFFTDRFGGAIVTQASRFAKSYTVFNDTIFFHSLPQIISLLFSLAVIGWYSPALALAVLALWIFAIWAIVKFAVDRLPIRRGAVAKESQQVGELADVITNSLTVKTFAAEDRERQRYGIVNEDRGWLYLRSWRRAVRNAWIIHGLCGIIQMLVLVVGIVLLQRGSINVATFLLFQVYIFRIVNDINDAIFTVRQFEVVAGDAQEMTELMEQAPLVQDKPAAEVSRIKQGAISFENMTFQYSDAHTQKALFNNFNMSIQAGEKIGLIGPSGGGKTTITRLLLRFIDIETGRIAVDDQDIRAIKQQDLRRAIAYVPQEPLLFHRSIKDNICYGRPGASDAEIISVAKKSFAHNFINSLPGGYETLVGERGVKLSGGQRQRIAIARAMLTNAPILVLDEATSALDSESERVIQKALWELMKDKTAVVIAHRLSTIQRLDRIVVLDEGKIVEQGSHSELLKQKGLYAKLWSHQSGGFIED